MEFKKEELVKSPLNYTGGKFKLLPQILPLFPNDINTFVDLFAGGCNVGINVKANRVICNDYMRQIIDLYNEFVNVGSDKAYEHINKRIEEYSLSMTNKEGYLKIRNHYNQFKNPLDLYVCICYAFNYSIRFNKKGEYNIAFGMNRSEFNSSLRDRLGKFIDIIQNITFTNYDFNEINTNNLNSQDFVYCDPPYLITCANYNEQDGWNETHERELLDLLDRLNEKGIRFALSNVLENKGKSNDILKEWCKKYNVHYLNHTYGNCNYHAKDKSGNSTVEVLITNY